jgi:3-oxoadipate enol-lactonase
MGFARVNGGVVHFSDEGPRLAPVLVFVNALGSDFRIWDDVARILSLQFRIIRYDKCGHGLSEAGPDRYDMADYARDLSALLDRLGVARATVVGISMGGVIAQELYRQRPSIFVALMLSDTAAQIGNDESWDARIAQIERGGIEAIADPVLQRWFTADFRARRSEELVGWRAMLTRTPTQDYLAACGAFETGRPARLRRRNRGPHPLHRWRGRRLDVSRAGSRDRRAYQGLSIRGHQARRPPAKS